MKKNLTIEERANLTKTQIDLRIEAGENIDPREEVAVGNETEDSIFAEADSRRSAGYGEHRVMLMPGKENRTVVKSVQVIKNGVITETKPYVQLRFVDVLTGAKIEKKFYAGMVEGLRRNINKEYDGVAEPMLTSEMLDFITTYPISVWTRWDREYNKVEVDFYDYVAWQKYKAERAQMSASARKSSGTNRVTENKATR